MGASSTLRVAVDSVELLHLARVCLIARLAFFAVGLGVSGGGADLRRACGCCDEADHAGAEQLTSPHCCLGPLAHRKLSLVGRGRGRHTTWQEDAFKGEAHTRIGHPPRGVSLSRM